jgi:hypothetical protein
VHGISKHEARDNHGECLQVDFFGVLDSPEKLIVFSIVELLADDIFTQAPKLLCFSRIPSPALNTLSADLVSILQV